jgi:hypothetical protein
MPSTIWMPAAAHIVLSDCEMNVASGSAALSRNRTGFRWGRGVGLGVVSAVAAGPSVETAVGRLVAPMGVGVGTSVGTISSTSSLGSGRTAMMSSSPTSSGGGVTSMVGTDSRSTGGLKARSTRWTRFSRRVRTPPTLAYVPTLTTAAMTTAAAIHGQRRRWRRPDGWTGPIGGPPCGPVPVPGGPQPAGGGPYQSGGGPPGGGTYQSGGGPPGGGPPGGGTYQSGGGPPGGGPPGGGPPGGGPPAGWP